MPGGKFLFLLAQEKKPKEGHPAFAGLRLPPPSVPKTGRVGNSPCGLKHPPRFFRFLARPSGPLQRGKAHRGFYPPLCHLDGSRLAGRNGEHCPSSAVGRVVCGPPGRVAQTPRQAGAVEARPAGVAQRGRLSLVPFFGETKKGTCRRATPGQPPYAHLPHGDANHPLPGQEHPRSQPIQQLGGTH